MYCFGPVLTSVVNSAISDLFLFISFYFFARVRWFELSTNMSITRWSHPRKTVYFSFFFFFTLKLSFENLKLI